MWSDAKVQQEAILNNIYQPR